MHFDTLFITLGKKTVFPLLSCVLSLFVYTNFIIFSLSSSLFAQFCGDEILVGDNDTLSSTGDLPSNVWKALQFTARASGTVSCFKVFLKDLPDPPNHLHNLGFALYINDPSALGGCGQPGTPIAYGTIPDYNWSFIGKNQWHDFPLTQTAQITQGDVYWVAFCSDGGHDGWHFGRSGELNPGHAERKRGCNTNSWNDMPDGSDWNIIYPDEDFPCTDNGNYSWYFANGSDITDLDFDGVINELDNCPAIPNGPNRGTCISGIIKKPCLNDSQCDDWPDLGFCSTNQEDTYPPHGNERGDACDCEGDFDCDGDLDGTDSALFKLDFGRSNVNDRCENTNPCNGDLDCDADVDGIDASLFKTDFGRNAFNLPCSTCTLTNWCSYPSN
jgi:hypothetical protein